MKINLGENCKVDLERLIETRLLVQANSGGGKSYCLRKLLEETHGHVQQIVLDLEGEFATLREKFDYLLVGKEGDIKIDIRSAELLAKKLLELNVSTIIDLYELKAHERILFVKRFLDAMVNAPKELWHPCLIIVDEAHVFCPEKGQSEAMGSVIDLMTRGRKRGYCGVLATQRLSKLHKDAAAEANNKLIGRTGLDVDMKRAGEELGFTSKTDILSLRDLEAGEFFVFGTAISNKIQKAKIGRVKTTHPKAGYKIIKNVTPPTETIKKMLGKLTDLPKMAEEELKTAADYKRKIHELQMELRAKPKGEIDENVMKRQIEFSRKRALVEAENHYKGLLNSANNQIVLYRETISRISTLAEKTNKTPPVLYNTIAKKPSLLASIMPRKVYIKPETRVFSTNRDLRVDVMLNPDAPLPQGERAILIAAAQHQDGITREQATQLTGYKRSSRDAYVSRLQAKGLIDVSNGTISATQAGLDALGNDFEPLPIGDELREYWLRKLPEGEKRILQAVIDNFPEPVDRNVLSEATGYQRSSRDAYISRLQARKLVSSERGLVKASEMLFG